VFWVLLQQKSVKRQGVCFTGREAEKPYLNVKSDARMGREVARSDGWRKKNLS
jgi:hypothetical protein